MDEQFKNNLISFLKKCIEVKNLINATGDNKMPSGQFNMIKSEYRGLDYTASFGKGSLTYSPWLVFEGYNQKVSRGIYPCLLFNTQSNVDNLEVSYGVSVTENGDVSWNDEFVGSLKHSNIKKFSTSYVMSAYTINEEEDIDLNIDSIITNLDTAIENFKKQLNNEKQGNRKVQYWILGAGEGAYLWDEFYKDGIAAIGWDTGDLRKYNSKEEIKEKLQEERNTDKTPKNDGKALWDFLQEMHIGDVVFVKRGSQEFVGRGIVKSDYKYEKDRVYQHIRDMDWTNNETHEYNDGKAAIKTLTNITRFPDYCQELEKLFSKNETQGLKIQKNHSLNQILYGPPGTGKTYNTVIQSVAIIEGKDVNDVSSENYEDVYNRFRKYRKEKQIDFITFHQSYSYEEFVEGIKPEEADDDETGILYSCQSGIFKDICNRAETRGNFEECYRHFIDDISETEKYNLKTPTNKDFAVSVRQNGSLKLYTGKDQKKGGSITKEKLRNACAGVWPDYYKGYYQGVINELKSKYGLSQGDVEKPYVLIIDEINRGNISKIFGELITLIEEDKRERLYAILPYSKEQFTVPKNLSIIGTMNTADRSIAAIDIALRRRFKFIEMMPNSDLVKNTTINGVNLKQLMDDLNRRISVLIDRDHQIGHAYFMHISNLSELKDAWFNKILPLLNEYFYGDWNKLKLVVKTFINEENVPEDLKEEYGDEKLYSFKRETSEADDKFISDLKGLFTK